MDTIVQGMTGETQCQKGEFHNRREIKNVPTYH